MSKNTVDIFVSAFRTIETCTYEEMPYRSDTAALLTITLYVFIAGVEFLMENLPKLLKRHISVWKIYVIHGNCLLGDTVCGNWFIYL